MLKTEYILFCHPSPAIVTLLFLQIARVSYFFRDTPVTMSSSSFAFKFFRSRTANLAPSDLPTPHCRRRGPTALLTDIPFRTIVHRFEELPDL